MAQNFALIREDTSKPVLKPIPYPKLRDDYIIVRTDAIALNPTDWTTIDAKGDPGTIVGCDYGGIVEEVGSKVTKPFKKGDRVAGFAHGGNDAHHDHGAFAKFALAKGDGQMLIPDGVSFEAAASVGVGVGSSGYALYKILKLPLPSDSEQSNEPVLIYGGSTATGTIAIQFAKLSGCKVITTCSPKHFDLMRKRGADAVYDYRTPNVGEQIRKDTEGKVSKVLDCVAEESSAAICAAAIGPNGGIYCNLLGIDCPRDDVKSEFFLGYSMSGEEYIFEGDTYPAQPEDFEFAREWYSIAEKLWFDGKWQPHPQEVRKGGLLGAIDGMQQMREGRGPSGVKLVYNVDDTEWPVSA